MIVILLLWISVPAAQMPARIVSTSPSITETLFALGLGNQVVGVSTYCRFPPEVSKLPKVGTFLRPSPELIARLTPSLVILHAGPNDAAPQLAKLRIPFITVERGTLPAVFSSINAIGKAAGTPERAGMLRRTEERHVRIVVEDRVVRSPEHDHREPRGEAQRHHEAQVRRPTIGLAEVGLRPVEGAHALRKLALTRKDLDHHLWECSYPIAGWKAP